MKQRVLLIVAVLAWNMAVQVADDAAEIVRLKQRVNSAIRRWRGTSSFFVWYKVGALPLALALSVRTGWLERAQEIHLDTPNFVKKNRIHSNPYPFV